MFNEDIQYPQFATIGIRRRTSQTYEYEFVVPVKMEHNGVIMLVIRDYSRSQFMDVLQLLYPDLTQDETSQISQEISSI